MGNVFFERFAALCKEMNETPNSVAKALGISSGSVTAWKNGTEPRSKTLAKLAEYFGVTTDYLLNGIHKSTVTAYNNGICVYTGNSIQEIETHLAERDSSSYEIKFRGPGVIITVDADASPSADQIDAVIAIYDPTHAQKAPTVSGERSVSDDDIKFALFGGDGEITDAMYDEVRRFAAFVKQREAEKKKE